jgi:hypothetical protein
MRASVAEPSVALSFKGSLDAARSLSAEAAHHGAVDCMLYYMT